jgi:hypothetical protein
VADPEFRLKFVPVSEPGEFPHALHRSHRSPLLAASTLDFEAICRAFYERVSGETLGMPRLELRRRPRLPVAGDDRLPVARSDDLARDAPVAQRDSPESHSS